MLRQPREAAAASCGPACGKWRDRYDPSGELSLEELRAVAREEFTSQARARLRPTAWRTWA